jgi:hypothetical protein
MLRLRTAYEITNNGQGWFLSHHHHTHLSTNLTYYPPSSGSSASPEPVPGPRAPFTPLPSYTLPEYDIQLPEVRVQVINQ